MYFFIYFISFIYLFIYLSIVVLSQCVSVFVDKRVVLCLLLHNLTFSCPRSQDVDPARDYITHEMKVCAYNNNNNKQSNSCWIVSLLKRSSPE